MIDYVGITSVPGLLGLGFRHRLSVEDVVVERARRWRVTQEFAISNELLKKPACVDTLSNNEWKNVRNDAKALEQRMHNSYKRRQCMKPESNAAGID